MKITIIDKINHHHLHHHHLHHLHLHNHHYHHHNNHHLLHTHQYCHHYQLKQLPCLILQHQLLQLHQQYKEYNLFLNFVNKDVLNMEGNFNKVDDLQYSNILLHAILNNLGTHCAIIHKGVSQVITTMVIVFIAIYFSIHKIQRNNKYTLELIL